VSDTGPGIPADVLASIFEMRFTTKSGGSGVGLYVARSVVQSHGGTILVHTDASSGTTFEIQLPIEAAVMTEREAGRPAA
jgi:signal transduction histidine kinase